MTDLDPTPSLKKKDTHYDSKKRIADRTRVQRLRRLDKDTSCACCGGKTKYECKCKMVEVHPDGTRLVSTVERDKSGKPMRISFGFVTETHVIAKRCAGH
jgi:hypothetical protein